MDVSKFQVEGEWLELKINSDRVPDPVRFKVKPLSAIEQIEYGDVARESREKYFDKLYDLILDWDLTKNGSKLECTPENRSLYMKFLLPLELEEEKKEGEPKEILADEDKDKADEEEPGKKLKSSVGLAIFEFASDFTNFIKN